MKKTVYLIVIIGIVLVISYFVILNTGSKSIDQNNQVPTSLSPTRAVSPATQSGVLKPNFEIDTSKKYTAILKTTEGDIVIELNTDQTPKTAANFINLSKASFYNKTTFHRIISGFMIQGGDPKGDGTGGPGYKFDDEPFEGEYKRGIVAMANSGPNTNGSQFFIMHKDSSLPKNYVIFGKVVKGMDVVDKIAEAPMTFSSSGERSKPVIPVTVTEVKIVEK